MKENQINERNCVNCYYYSQHYSKQGIKYSEVFCGHCLNKRNQNKKRIKSQETCELWESITIKKEERKKSIKETLEFMSKCLYEITLILKDDELP